MATQKLSSDIDRMLEQYLQLLDTYTSLRSQLSVLQSSIHQNIARANFSADRGIRYGEQLYDARMQALRICRIAVDTAGVPEDAEPVPTAGGERVSITILPRSDSSPDSSPTTSPTQTTNENTTDTQKPSKEKQASPTSETETEKPRPRDPLRMFGILVPQALRTAQTEAVKMVGDVVPKLVQLDLQMRELEIEIRRGRKRKAKAEALEVKMRDEGSVRGGAAGEEPGGMVEGLKV